MLILIDTLTGEAKGLETAETPFGAVAYRLFEEYKQQLAVIGRPEIRNPKAVAYAARALGSSRVIGLVRDAGVEAPQSPANFIEFTSERPTTFFETIGSGYVQQNPPFCPELRGAMLAAGVEAAGNLVVLDRLPEIDVRRWWHDHRVDLISTDTQPEGALCRELELCYAVLVLPVTMSWEVVVPEIVANLPGERNCGCDQLMATARKFGKIRADWFEML